MNSTGEALRRLAALAEEVTGLVLSEGLRRRLAAHAERRLERLRLDSLDTYLEILYGALSDEDSTVGTDHDGRRELDLLIEEVTVRETSFYRDILQCDAIGATFTELGGGRRLAAWSAGCASGEEVYTLAILAAEAGVDVEILGTDINPLALEIADVGVYDSWTLRRLVGPLRERYFEAVDDGRYRIREVLRSKVRFRVHNLLTPAPRPSTGRPGWDVILCRNLFIYLARDTMNEIARRLVDVLDTNGCLFTGAAETLAPETGAELHLLPGTFAYRRADSPGPQSRAPIPKPSHDAHLEESKANDDALLRARAALEEGRVDEALRSLDEAARCEPLRGEICYWRALAQRRLGQGEKARDELRRAFFLDPQLWPAAFLLAGLHEDAGEIDRAVAAYGRTLDAARTSGAAHAALCDTAMSAETVISICRQKVQSLRGSPTSGATS